METTLTLEQRQALRKALDFDITRYLIVNSINKIDGGERADRHVNISKAICHFIFDINPKEKYHYTISASWLAVHDYLADVLTDRMDEVIGFPVFQPLYDVDMYKDRFFNVIVDKINDIKTVAKESLENN
jgi:hypothetical protein